MISERFNRKVRVRVSGLLVRDGGLLLVAHRKRGEVYWLLPGGGVEYGETLQKSLAREFGEELGIRVEVGRLLFMCDSIDPRGRRHILNVTFRCTSPAGDIRLGSDRRLHDYGFFPLREIPSMRLYPPVNDTLVSILEGREPDCYLGSLWLA